MFSSSTHANTHTPMQTFTLTQKEQCDNCAGSLVQITVSQTTKEEIIDNTVNVLINTSHYREREKKRERAVERGMETTAGKENDPSLPTSQLPSHLSLPQIN